MFPEDSQTNLVTGETRRATGITFPSASEVGILLRGIGAWPYTPPDRYADAFLRGVFSEYVRYSITFSDVVGPSAMVDAFFGAHRDASQRRCWATGRTTKELIVSGKNYVLFATNWVLVETSLSVSDAQDITYWHRVALLAATVRLFDDSAPWALVFPDRWRTDNVVQLARMIRDGRTDRLPILVDALLDADCDNEKILNRIRYLPEHWWYRPTEPNWSPWLLDVIETGLDGAASSGHGYGDY